ncbi:MAG: hypothetical protein DSZ29_02315 [Aquificaceae bacterium]|nr:MAG: hypothetical protein DSZ29_02315 [Aquificaceae bacterium]
MNKQGKQSPISGTSPATQSIDWQATLLNPDNRNTLSKLLYQHQAKTLPILNIIALDTSGSTLASEQLSAAKAIVQSLCDYFYQQRQMMALLCFGNQQVEWLIPASKAPFNISKILLSIQAGGGTPLAEALTEIQCFLLKRQARHRAEKQRLFLITDGRSRDNIDNLVLAKRIAVDIHVLDSEKHEIKLSKAKQLAHTLNANYVNLADL